jgi:hypothetical protein
MRKNNVDRKTDCPAIFLENDPSLRMMRKRVVSSLKNKSNVAIVKVMRN